MEKRRLPVLLRLFEKTGRWFRQVDLAYDASLTNEKLASAIPGWIVVVWYLSEMVLEWEAEDVPTPPAAPGTGRGPPSPDPTGTRPGTP